jgi:uncharacterized protein (DUF2384 family)
MKVFAALVDKTLPYKAIANLNQVCPIIHRRSLDELDELGLTTKKLTQAQIDAVVRPKRSYTRRLTRTGNNYSLAEHT